MAAATTPIHKKRYFLHLRVNSIEERTKADIVKLGGAVVDFLTADVDIVISDHPHAEYLAQRNRRLSHAGEKTVPSNPNRQHHDIVSTSKSVATISGSYPHGSNASSLISRRLFKNATNERLMNRHQSSKACPENVPVVLREAVSMGVKIVVYSVFSQKLAKELKRLKASKSVKPETMAPSKKLGKYQAQVVRLNDPFMKIEHKSLRYRPVYARFEAISEMNFATDRQGCVFSIDDDEQNQDLQREPSTSDGCSPGAPGQDSRKAAAKRRVACLMNESLKAIKAAESPTAATGSKKRHPQADNPAFCELCNIKTENLAVHLNSACHKQNATNNDLYKEFDAEVSKGQSLDFFSCANTSRSEETRNDCTSTPAKRQQLCTNASPSLGHPLQSPATSRYDRNRTPIIPPSPIRPVRTPKVNDRADIDFNQLFKSPRQRNPVTADSNMMCLKSPIYDFKRKQSPQKRPLAATRTLFGNTPF